MGMGWRRRVSSRAVSARLPGRVALVLLLVGAGACTTTEGATRAVSGGVRSATTSSSIRPPTSTIVAIAAPPSTLPPAPPPAAAVLPLTGPDPSPATTCADALAYLASHQAPGFVDSCGDGSAFGHLGVTCADAAAMCPGARFIHIACPAPFVYMNEAHNSWTLTGQGSGIDPHGQGTPAERATCAPRR